jgi:hypothetical protein
MNIPAIVALHHSRTMIHEDELIIVDGTQGVVIVNPDKHVLAEYKLKQNQARLERDKLKRLRTAPASTLDGTPVQLLANIELPSDVEPVKASGAGRHRPLPQRVPVHEPPRAAPTRRSSTRPIATWSRGCAACRSPSAPSTSAPTSRSTARATWR